MAKPIVLKRKGAVSRFDFGKITRAQVYGRGLRFGRPRLGSRVGPFVLSWGSGRITAQVSRKSPTRFIYSIRKIERAFWVTAALYNSKCFLASFCASAACAWVILLAVLSRNADARNAPSLSRHFVT